MKLSCIWNERQVSAVAIKIDALADAVAKELASYSQECTDELKTMVKKTAKEAVQELKVSSPKESGEYASGWTSRVEYESQEDIRVSIYNKKKPQLTHLLEDGHAKVTGGRVAGQPHIGPAEDNAAKKLDNKVKVVFKG